MTLGKTTAAAACRAISSVAACNDTGTAGTQTGAGTPARQAPPQSRRSSASDGGGDAVPADR